MKIKILKVEDKLIKFSVASEDYTLGNLLQHVLLKDKRVLGAGFYIQHPLNKELVFTVFFKRKTSFEYAKKIILQNVEKLEKYLLDIKQRLMEEIGDSSLIST